MTTPTPEAIIAMLPDAPQAIIDLFTASDDARLSIAGKLARDIASRSGKPEEALSVWTRLLLISALLLDDDIHEANPEQAGLWLSEMETLVSAAHALRASNEL